MSLVLVHAALISAFLLSLCDAKSYIDFHGDDHDSTVPLPNSCLGQPDTSSTMLKLGGTHDDAIINAACSNEWTIINLKQDNEWESYLAPKLLCGIYGVMSNTIPTHYLVSD